MILFGSAQDFAAFWGAWKDAPAPERPVSGYLGGADYFPPLVCRECMERSAARKKLPWRGSGMAVRAALAVYGIDVDAMPKGAERDDAYEKMARALEAAATQDGAVW